MTNEFSPKGLLGRRNFIKGMTAAMIATSVGRVMHASPPPVTRISVGSFQKLYNPSIGENQPWYINDHCFIQSFEGIWHLFGITHPEPAAPMDEKYFAHATAPTLTGRWTKRPMVLQADPRKGETLMWAPHVIKAGDVYFMFYCAGGAYHQE